MFWIIPIYGAGLHGLCADVGNTELSDAWRKALDGASAVARRLARGNTKEGALSTVVGGQVFQWNRDALVWIRWFAWTLRFCKHSRHQSINQEFPKQSNSRLIVKFRKKKKLVQMTMSGYDFLKSQVLSCWRKVESVCDVVISSGRVFQTRGPATVNARSPTVERLTDGTIRRLVPPERGLMSASARQIGNNRNEWSQMSRLTIRSAVTSDLVANEH